MGLQEDFDAAVDRSNNVLKADNLSNDERLAMYALFKQGSVGDCNIARPGIFDQKGRYKWDAWDAKKGMSQDDAKAEYIKLIDELIAKHGTK